MPLLASLAWVLATHASTSDVPAHDRLSVLEQRSGWRQIFDGTTFDHWTVESDPRLPTAGKSAEILDGWLVAPEASGLSLRCSIPVSDCDLTCDYRSWNQPEVHCTSLRVAIEGPLVIHPYRGSLKLSSIENETFEITPWSLRANTSPNGLWDIHLEPSIHRHAVRNVRLRDLHQLPGHPVLLFDGHSLDAWHPIGDASFTVDDESILAQSTTGAINSFLVSNHSFGDFLLDLELQNELPGNSGIQIRSRVVGDDPARSYATGYQIEIDPSSRAWSGGLYEERGRGWLQDLSKNAAARKAFRPNEWNRYRIECIGPWIRAWVNDVPTTDTFDPEALEGLIALQVHSGKSTKLRFHALRLHVFGRHEWKPLDAKLFGATGANLGNDFGLRLTRAPGSTNDSLAGWRLHFRGPARDGKPPTLALDDPRLADTKTGRPWQQLSLLAYGDRIVIHRDHERLPPFDFPTDADGPIVSIEKPADAGERSPFATIESLEPVTR